MPVLSYGNHVDPRDGACLLEYVSILAGESFTDRPACVDPVLAAIGRTTNDSLVDRNRHLLVPLIPRLIGTAGLREVTETEVHMLVMTFDIRVGTRFREAGIGRDADIISRDENGRWILAFDGYDAWMDRRNQIRVDEFTKLLDHFDAKYRTGGARQLTVGEERLLLEAVTQ
jgi:hypothetical protein